LELDHITESLSENADQFEDVTQRQILFLMWDIHRDARRFFSRFALMDAGDDILPSSDLAVAARMIETGAILTSTVGVPEEQFLGRSITEGILTGSGGGTSRNLFPEAKEASGPYVNSAIIPEFKAALEEVLKAFPRLNVHHLLKHTDNVSLNSITLGRRGHHCINYNIIGRCSDRRCR
jgi:hypothetical protein